MIDALLAPFAAPQLLGRLPLDEVSGVAVGVHGTYVHEDSGAPAAFARVDRAGRVLARFDLGVPARDWEDVAAAPDARGTPSLWFADVGDNAARRDEVQVHRVDEPAAGAVGAPTTYRFAYEDGPRDAEALLVLPGGRRLVVVTKELSGGAVYAADLDAGVLRRVAALDLQPSGTAAGPLGPLGGLLVTGGDVAPDGSRLVLRTYTDLHEWALRDDLAATFALPAVVSPLPPTEQGEAVAYDGPDAVLVASEGDGAPLHRLVRQAQEPAPDGGVEVVRETRRAVPWPLVAGAAGLLAAAGLVALRRRRGSG